MSTETLTIRDVPDDAHEALRIRADLHDQSLQAYLHSYLTSLTSKPDMKTLMAWVRDWKAETMVNVSIETILADLDAERA